MARIFALTCVAGLVLASDVSADAPATCGLPGLVRPSGPACPRPTPESERLREAPALAGTVSPDGIISTVTGSIAGSATGVAMRFLVRWVDASAAAGLRTTASLIATTTRPQLQSSWFSASYWRVAAISLLLTLPFLCGAAMHAIVRSDLSLIVRAAFGYLPLAVLGVYLLAPLVTLLLAAVDGMCGLVTSASGHGDSTFIVRAAAAVGASALAGDPFLGLVVGALTVIATISLWLELLIRDAAVEILVLMLPLFFAAMVWPARRVWVIRAIETLAGLILAKFVIVCVLAFGGAAMSSAAGPVQMLTGLTVVLLATLSPWALLRILPIHEVAAAAGGLSSAPRQVAGSLLQDARGHLFGGEASSPQIAPLGTEAGEQRALDRQPRIGGSSRTAQSGSRGESWGEEVTASAEAVGTEDAPASSPGIESSADSRLPMHSSLQPGEEDLKLTIDTPHLDEDPPDEDDRSEGDR